MAAFLVIVLGIIALALFVHTISKPKGYSAEVKKRHEQSTNKSYIWFFVIMMILMIIFEANGWN